SWRCNELHSFHRSSFIPLVNYQMVHRCALPAFMTIASLLTQNSEGVAEFRRLKIPRIDVAFEAVRRAHPHPVVSNGPIAPQGIGWGWQECTEGQADRLRLSLSGCLDR